MRENPDVQRCVKGAWGADKRNRAFEQRMAACAVSDDLCGTFKTVIGAIFAAVMQRAVVCAV